ncbi:MAG: DNA-binding domain-containing protein [Methylotenera sp.]
MQLQSDFQAYLLDSSKGAAFKSQIVNDKKVGVKTRLGIYYDAYRLRIIEVLSNSYPILKALLGDGIFEQAARSYIDIYPSTYRNMRWVGDKMSEHLQENFPQYPIAAEMATFEWGLSLAFDADDAPILGLQDLAAIAPENWADLLFQFHPSMQLFTFKWNVLRVWQALNSEESPPKISQIEEPCVVWRKDLNSHYRSLDLAEYAAIQLVIAGTSFGELCEKMQETATEEAATMQAAQYLSGWLNEGLMTKTL